ncbi:carbon-nitrogen hydrolase family protein [Kerstersia gyiorum]|uniref:Putative amidohydrolase n=1 Tax=Kerstersia gyiorum TaxID=206506 RepID=A0A4V2EZ62_9BURK|nr:carbon-nitrogen hydrolase family protein [Kerstersia gyiorum]MCO7637869.1 carbon-nitrogen hydrolase family protein [Pseudomonas sp. S 311-6]KAB0542327.1 carbon-nitrogen hydrolase family protein [Kerstersia gyiorum]MCP1634047.1 putative amidohydrolase [Kerstersia gyiorum]MCP1637292.1 putative amidohydrolase [Kerstersia gyiorum]MCP1671914.1 putative amidohydrolase [Kerstersia gyiorum]
MRVAVCQLNSREDKPANIATALDLLDQAAARGVDIAVLPEYTDYMGPNDGALATAETIPGPTSERIAAKAREHGMWVLLGSMREIDPQGGRCANTSLLFDRNGAIAARYTKLHLYDVDLPGRVTYLESATVRPGKEIVTTDIEGITAGLSICYDMRFPELFRLQTLAGAKILFIPAAFNLYTGRDHWEVLLRARAIENQCYVVAAGQIGKYLPNGACNGRSMIIDPWGTVQAVAQDTTSIAVADLDFDFLQKVREEMPCLPNRRGDLYQLETKHVAA